MDLQDPSKKMSKSNNNEKGYITMFDDEATIKRKIKSAVTDSLTKIQYDPINQKGLANLITIYASCKDISIDEVVSIYKDSSYKQFKEDLGQLICDILIPIQEEYRRIIKSKELQNILDKGRDIAQEYAFKKMRKCKRKIGLGRK